MTTELRGLPTGALDTPMLLVDFDRFAANVARCLDECRAAGVRVRPHLKTGKSVPVARYLLEAGAHGICVAKLGEAEIFLAAGIDDVLVTSEIVGTPKLARLVRLARQHPGLKVVVDSAAGAAQLAAALAEAGLVIDVLIELNLGQNRCGVLPEEAVTFAQTLAAHPQLHLLGVQGYEGHLQHVRALAEREQRSQAALSRLAETVQALRAAGFAVPHVTTGGTGTYAFCARHPVVSEVQPGSFMFMDADYGADEGLSFAQALTVTATVISAPRPGEVVVDAGLKSLSTDSGPARLASHTGWSYRPGGDEHGILSRTADDAPPLTVGDRVAFVPSHIDTTVNLHDQYVVVRGGCVVDVWPIAARGKVQ